VVSVELGDGRVWGILSPARILSLHLPGALKIDPPGSTRQWCFLWLESSAGDAKRGAVPLKQVRTSSGIWGGVHGVETDGASVLHDLQVGAVGVAFFRGSRGGSSGLSSGGNASRGT